MSLANRSKLDRWLVCWAVQVLWDRLVCKQVLVTTTISILIRSFCHSLYLLMPNEGSPTKLNIDKSKKKRPLNLHVLMNCSRRQNIRFFCMSVRTRLDFVAPEAQVAALLSHAFVGRRRLVATSREGGGKTRKRKIISHFSSIGGEEK